MPTCNGKLELHPHTGEPCPKIVTRGQKYCRWHDPEDDSWRELYANLRKATPEERSEIVVLLIEDHPDHKLVLPKRDQYSAPLQQVNLQGKNLWRADLKGADLWQSNLRNTCLESAQLQEAWLNGADIRDADLILANLQNARLYNANLQRANLTEAELQGANLTEADLQNANLNGAYLQKADLQSANLQGAILLDANLLDADLRDAKLQGVDFSRVENMSNVYLSGAWFDRNRIKLELLGDRVREEYERDYSAAKGVYLALKQNFDDLGDYDAASWAYCRERRMEKLEAKEMGRTALKERKWSGAAENFFKYISDTIVEWLCNYGESVWRVIGWMAVLLFAVEPFTLSLLGGFSWEKDLQRQYFTLISVWDRFWFSYWLHILYSLGGLGTADISGLQPANIAVKLASSLFSIIGIFLVGLLGFVAGNRIRRS